MRIQLIKHIKRPRIVAGEMHEIREVPSELGRSLVDCGYAVELSVRQKPIPITEPMPVPKVKVLAITKPKTAKKKAKKSKAGKKP